MKYTLLSGGARGSNMYWQNVALQYGVTAKAFSFRNLHGGGENRIILDDEQLKLADDFLYKANRTLQRRFPNSQKFTNNLQRLNWYQIKDTDRVLAIAKFHC